MRSYILVAISGTILSLSLIAIAQLHTWHWADFSKVSTIPDSLTSTWLESEKELNIVHFLTGTCSCSKEIVDYLVAKTTFANKRISEKVILIDTEKNHPFFQQLSQKGYPIERVDRFALDDELSEALVGVPLLLIHDQEMNVRYAGGYDDKVITPFSKINLEPIVARALANHSQKTKAIKGCIVSKKYQNLMDPLGLKYVKK